MRDRRHHNNKGYKQIKNGKVITSLEHIARKLKLPFYKPSENEEKD